MWNKKLVSLENAVAINGEKTDRQRLTESKKKKKIIEIVDSFRSQRDPIDSCKNLSFTMIFITISPHTVKSNDLPFSGYN